ncbi:MAG TPA: hypothetical protein DDZ91_02095, partial [Firmicutes bacterium]|nr:hypothetical protein [Bacillota bacterium]
AYHLQWRTFNYHKFYALIPETGKQALLRQRITSDFGPFTFGFSETALLSNRAPWFFYLPLPLVPVYAYQHIGFSVSDTPNLNSTANILMGADLVWRPNPNFQVYLEYLADDQPGLSFEDGKLVFAAADDNPWRIGCQGGIGWQQPFNLKALELYAEYTLIAHFTYSGINENYLNYTYKNYLIGDPLGPDAERLNLELVYNPSPSRRWNFAINRERHGEGELGDKWVHTEGQTLVFLTGIIETTTTVKIAATKFYPNCELTLAGGLSVVKNQDHQRGKTGYLPTFNLQTTWKNLRLVTQ